MPKVVLHDVGLLAFLTASKLACSGPTSDKIVVETFVKCYAIHSIIVQIFKWIKNFITELRDANSFKCIFGAKIQTFIFSICNKLEQIVLAVYH